MARRIRWSGLKSRLFVAVYHLSRVAPAFAIKSVLSGCVAVIRAGRWLPGNPLRRACEAVTFLAARRGIEHRPASVYRGLTRQVSLVLRAFVDLYKHGAGELKRRYRFDPSIPARVQEVVAESGSVVLCVPHNVASVLSAVSLAGDCDVLLVVRNREGGHNRVSRAVMDRMEVELLLVRHQTPMAISKACMTALKAGKALIATVDNNYRKVDAVEVDVFGLPKGFGPWAARIAAKRGSPILPTYPRIENGEVTAWFGEPLVDRDPARLIAHYVEFFEQCILRDPSSWGFLGDKRWGRHLQAAREHAERSLEVDLEAHRVAAKQRVS